MFRISLVLGVYYLAGFVVTFSIACYQVYRVVYESPSARDRDSVMSVEMGKKRLQYTIIALTAGTITLVIEGWWPTFWVHLVCRTFQGGAGGIIFFNSFLLSANLFLDS